MKIVGSFEWLVVFLFPSLPPPRLFYYWRDILNFDGSCCWRASATTASTAAAFVVVGKKKKKTHHHRTQTTTTTTWRRWRVSLLLDTASTGAADNRRTDSSNNNNKGRQSLNRKRNTRPRTTASSTATRSAAQQQKQRQWRSPSFSRNQYNENHNTYSKKNKKQYYKQSACSSSLVIIRFLEETFPSCNSTNAELATWMLQHYQGEMLFTANSTNVTATAHLTNTSSTAAEAARKAVTWQQELIITSSSSSSSVWTSHDDTALIRYLRQRHAYTAIVLFMQQRRQQQQQQRAVQPPNVFTYTAAISALAASSSSSHHRQECWTLFQEMYRHNNIQPSSYTYSALFQACHGHVEAVSLYKRLVRMEQQQQNLNSTRNNIWTKPVWESAIYACARITTLQDGGLFRNETDEFNDDDDGLTNDIMKQMSAPTNSSTAAAAAAAAAAAWDTAQFFVQRMLSCGLKLSTRTYLALLFVCSETKDWKHAKELYQSLEQQQQQQAQSSNIIPMTSRMYGAVLQVCAVTGEHTNALQILQDMQTKRGMIPNVRHCTSYLKALIASGKVETAVEFLLHMAGAHASNDESLSPNLPFTNLTVATPDLIAIQTVLRSCNYEQAQNLLQLAKEGELGGLENMPDERFYNTVLSKCEEPAQAKDIIRQMQLSRRHRIGAVPPSKLSYTKAITVCRKAQDVDTARFFLTSAKENGIEPDVYMYSAAIWAAAGSSDLVTALEFLAEMKANDCSPNIVSYNGVIAAFAANEDCSGAVEMYETTLERGLEGDFTTFHYLVRAARKVKDTNERIVLLERVLKPVASRDKYTIGVVGPLQEALIGSYGAVGRIDDALDLFDRIEGPGNIACLRAITFACSVASPPSWQDAISILHTSDIVGGQAPVFVDQVALGYAMLACSKANEWEESLRLLRLYGGGGVSIAAINSLIASCGRGGRPDMSLEVLNEMESSYGLSPDLRSYRNAVIACNQAEHAPKRQVNQNRDDNRLLFQWWECALSLLRRMKEDKLTPDIQTYSSAISACEAAGQWQRALGVLQSMMDDANDDVGLNVYCFNAAIAACEKGGAWVEALELYERMKATKNRLLQPTVVTYGSLILALDKAGQKEVAISIWREAVRKGMLRPWRITQDGQGNKIRALDLHQFSAAMTRACLRSHLESLLHEAGAGSSNNQVQQQQSLTIVVGKGLRSQGDPVLLPTVQTLLWDEYGIRAIANEENAGRIFLSASILEDMIARKRWR